MDFIRRLYAPALYQGGNRRSRYFEGWYFKIDTDDGRDPLAVIPGVSYAQDGASHAFVQVNRADGRTSYFEYPVSEFSSAVRGFEIEIGGNRFSGNGMSLDLAGESERIAGEVTFSDWSEWPVTLLSPGIMGPYRFVPLMECYHGVLSMDHGVSGIIEFDDVSLRFDGGRGYTEKDWGRSFPQAWVWAQCNGFDIDGISVMLSVARIPWLRSAFTGVIAGVLLGDRLVRFATYTGAHLEYLRTTDGEAEVVIADSHYRLRIRLSGARPGTLRSPVLGGMEGTVYEALRGTMHVTLEQLSKGTRKVLLDTVSDRAAVELMDAAGLLRVDER